MTEADWLAGFDPHRMLDHLGDRDRLSDRKQRLLDCACVRRAAGLLTDPAGWAAVEAAERYAEGEVTQAELAAAQAGALAAADARAGRAPPGQPNSYSVLAAAAGAAWEYRAGADPLRHAAEAVGWAGADGIGPAERRQARARVAAEFAAQAALVREVFGNPFRPVAFDPSWRTPTAVALATAMYEARDFGAMPVLADALEEAGCDDADVLDHCRRDGVHVRGCWVVDAILGKG